MRRLSLMATLMLISLTLAAGCADKEALPFKGSGPVGTPKSRSDAKVKDASSGDTAQVEAGVDAAPVDAASVGEGGSGTSCTVDCDCPQGEACFAANGTCTKESIPYYCCNKLNCPVTQNCTDHLGLPGTCGLTGTCNNQCDCEQGLTCNGTLCVVGGAKTYCCTKSGCPSGSSCLNKDGSTGTCP